LTEGDVPSRMMFEPLARDARDATPRIPGYAPVRHLGSGSSATVWLAEQQRPFSRHLALKVFDNPAGSEAILERFRTERDILSKLPREGFRDIYDAGITADGRPYLAMEFVDGEQLLAASKTMTELAAVAALFMDIGVIVGQAHAIGFVHLDLKPSNVLVVRGRDRVARPRIIDFGLGAAEGSRSSGRGSRGFAAPEVHDGGEASKASDVYSLAAMLRLVLESRPDWQQGDLARRLAEVADRNLAPMPSQRAGDGSRFAEEIAAALAGMRRRRMILTAAATTAGGVVALGAGWLALAERPPRRAPPHVPVERHVPQQYPTVQAAVDAARAGDIIRIAPGVHRGHVLLEGKSVSLQGRPGMAATTVLDAAGYEAATVGIFGVEPPLSTVSDLTITHSGVKGLSACGIAYQRSGGGQIRFERCIIRDNVAVSDSTPGGANILGDAVFEACAFIGNRPGYRGAAFAVYDGCTVDAVNCSFRDHPEGSALIAVRKGALVRLDGCVIVGASRLCTSKGDSQIMFSHCRGSDIRVVGGTGFVDGGANCWDCCVDEDGDGIPELESAIVGLTTA
jgi:hypothetical protein